LAISLLLEVARNTNAYV